MPIANVHKSIIVMNSLDTRFTRNVFEAIQKTCSTCFIGSKTTRLRLVVLNVDKTLLLVFQTLPNGSGQNYYRVCARRPCWRTKTIEDICIKVEYIS